MIVVGNLIKTNVLTKIAGRETISASIVVSGAMGCIIVPKGKRLVKVKVMTATKVMWKCGEIFRKLNNLFFCRRYQL